MNRNTSPDGGDLLGGDLSGVGHLGLRGSLGARRWLRRSAGAGKSLDQGVTAPSSAPRHEPARHSPPSQLCRPSFTFASASVSAPAAAGARRAARGRAALRDPGGGGGLALGPFLVLLRAPAAFDVSATARPRGPWRPPLLPTAPPALRHTALPLNPPTVGVGQRRGEPEKGRKGAASPSGQRGSRKRNFSLPPPACGPQPAPPHADGNCT